MFNPKVIGADQKNTTSGSAKSLAVVTSPARLYSVTAYNGSGGTLYLQVFDSSTVPADCGSPIYVVQIASQVTGGFDWQDGIPMTAGVYVCWSTTDTTKTIVGANAGPIAATFRKTI